MKYELRAMKLAETALKTFCRKSGYKVQSAVEVTENVVLNGTIYAEFDVCKFTCIKFGSAYILRTIESTHGEYTTNANNPIRAVLDLCKHLKAQDATSRAALQHDQESIESISMEVDEYLDDAKQATKMLETKLQAIFRDGYTARAYIQNLVGDPTFLVSIYNVPPDSSNLDFLNAKMQVRCIMHLANDSGKLESKDKFELELLTQSYQSRNKGLKFRKIAGKSPLDVANKFLLWVIKNKAIMMEEYN
jgi:hypothetical protein